MTSSQYGPWSGSFAFVIAPGPRGRQSDPVALPDPSSWHSHVGEAFDIDVVGSSQGTVWGTTVYTDDSPLAVAAVHAGVLDPGQRAKVRVTILLVETDTRARLATASPVTPILAGDAAISSSEIRTPIRPPLPIRNLFSSQLSKRLPRKVSAAIGLASVRRCGCDSQERQTVGSGGATFTLTIHRLPPLPFMPERSASGKQGRSRSRSCPAARRIPAQRATGSPAKTGKRLLAASASSEPSLIANRLTTTDCHADQ